AFGAVLHRPGRDVGDWQPASVVFRVRELDRFHERTDPGLRTTEALAGVHAERARARVGPDAGKHREADAIELRDVGHARDAELRRQRARPRVRFAQGNDADAGGKLKVSHPSFDFARLGVRGLLQADV